MRMHKDSFITLLHLVIWGQRLKARHFYQKNSNAMQWSYKLISIVSFAIISLGTSITVSFPSLFRYAVCNVSMLLQGTSVLSPIVPAGVVCMLAFIIWQKSPSQVYENHPVLYILSFGMVFAKITNKLVVSILCQKITSTHSSLS